MSDGAHGDPLPVRNRDDIETLDSRITTLEKLSWAARGVASVLSIIAAALAAAIIGGLI